MKKLSYNYQILIATILIIIGLFYWYEYRPSNIKSGCSEIAKEKVIVNEVNSRLIQDDKYSSLTKKQKDKLNEELYNKLRVKNLDIVISERYENYKKFYDTCLSSRGL